MRTNFLIYSVFICVFLVVYSCTQENPNLPNKRITNQQAKFNPQKLNFGIVDFPYSTNEIKKIIESKSEKANWPKVKITATFGGFLSSGGNNPCAGCDHCGCCIGLCIEVEKSKLLYRDLTTEEISEGNVMFDVIDFPLNNWIVLIPYQNIDNGDGFLHVDGDHSLSKEVSNYIGRNIILAMGSYKIDYSTNNPFGIVVVNTK
jgi:hypothetical protein